jgi:Na+/proline symporter
VQYKEPLKMSSKIKTLALASSLAISSVSATYAGGFAEPRIEPEVMAPDTVVAQTAAASAPGGIIVPLILLALIAAVGIANAGGGGTPVPPIPPIGPA